jgi:prolyl-tRNA editing enzyme YbaK/EbsC (Cys-tRNA(Pro) deacylase)
MQRHYVNYYKGEQLYETNRRETALTHPRTQYQYRKRKAEQERLQTPEETQQPEARVEKTLCVKSVMKKIMKLTKENLKSQLNDKKNHWTNYRNIT